jgi:hypothetical protein
LDAVAQAELGEYPADMDFHRALGQEQAGRDLAIGHACRDAGEDVLLAAGQGLPYLGGVLAAGWFGRLGRGELAHEAAGDGRPQDSAS